MRHRPMEPRPQSQPPTDFGTRKGRIICSGLRPDGYVHTAPESERANLHDIRPAAPLATLDDPWAWHEFPERPPVSMRRHRRIDVWRDQGELTIRPSSETAAGA
jgi:hypothetical protein